MFTADKDVFISISNELNKIETEYIERFGAVRSQTLLKDLNDALMI